MGTRIAAVIRLIPFACLGLGSAVQAQDHWLDRFSSVNSDEITDLVTDAAGNAYVIGDFSQSMTFWREGIEGSALTSTGGRDILVAKLDANGEMLWAVKAGGGALDVGLKLALGPDGLAITGLFTGTADLFGTSFTALGGSTDLFVAKLDLADGQAQWVRTAGSAAHTDTPAGIAVNSSGAVIVTGKFKGAAIFDTDTLYSAWDPWTLEVGFDVFIASWSAAGTLQWLQQGSGPHDDEGVDVVCDASDMLYVTGQFSDTIMFDVQHPNVSLNSMFVIKFDAAGNELWFRKCGGSTYNQMSDLRWSNAGDLLMTGDVSNTMYWVDGVPTPVPNTDPHAYFILRVSSGGTLLEATTLGSESAVHSASITEQADSVVVFGEFECSFTGLQDAYAANGLFMATGLKDLFITKHLSSDLSFVEAQQFGGRGAKRAGAITTVQDELLFAGSFNEYLFLPRAGVFWGDDVPPFPFCPFITTNNWLPYCDDLDYSKFAWGTGYGLSDGFLTKGYEEDRAPYDWWNRPTTPPCDRIDLSDEVCINAGGFTCPDSVSGCGSVNLYSTVPFPRSDPWFCPFGPTVGAFNSQYWSNGSTQDQTTAYFTGWYYFDVFSTNSCMHWRDSIYVTVLPEPDPRISDTSGVFVNSYPPMIHQTCEQMLVWATQVDPTDQVYWTVGTDTTWSDTVAVTASGPYTLHVISANGCTYMHTTYFNLVINPPFPNITGVESHFYAMGAIFTEDTIGTCSATCATGQFINTWFVDGVPSALPPTLLLHYESVNGCTYPNSTYNTSGPIGWSVEISGPGWYQIQVDMMLEYPNCDTTAYYATFTDSLYILPGQPAQFTVSPAQMCAGDTIAIPFQCLLCDSVSWSGPGIVWTSANGDSILVDQVGSYYFSAYHTAYGNTCQSNSQAVVSGPYPPPIFMVPADGVICPSDSVLLYTYGAGTAWEWSGPGAITLPNNDSIWVTEPGDYYLTVTLYPGCTSTNGPRTVYNFSSPFIEAFPTGTICVDGTVDLHLVSGPGSTIAWQPPLSGSGEIQTVSAPGIYSCIVSSCGIEWTLFYEVLPTTVSAAFDTTVYLLCENEPLVLTAPDGGDIYQWIPSGMGQQLVVDSAGVYQVIVIDAFGCSDTSALITVLPHTITLPATAEGDTICAGESAMVSGNGSGVLAWYDSADTSSWLGDGSLYTFVPFATDTLYLLQYEDGCPGIPVAAVVIVNDAPPPPLIDGDSLYCTGDVFQLIADHPGSGQVLWYTPGGTFLGDTIGPWPATEDLSGLYWCTVVGEDCPGDTAGIAVLVSTTPPAPDLTGDLALCEEDTLYLMATGVIGEPLWIGPGGIPYDDPLIIVNVTTGDAGTYQCYTVLNGCTSDTTAVLVVISPCEQDPVVPNVVTPNSDGHNDVIELESPNDHPITLDIYNRWGQLLFTRSGSVVKWDGRVTGSGEFVVDGVYYYVVEYQKGEEVVSLTGYIQVLH